MEWLSPMLALYTAAVAVPLLLLLYFLKLKRREQLVSSTFLWKKAVQDLQVNAPFQKLRRNILLLLQMLMLFAIIFALGWPILSFVSSTGQRYVILIDRSASMNSVDSLAGASQNISAASGNQKSRLDIAKEQAKVFVESLRSGTLISLKDKGNQIMVIAFDNHSRVMCNFTSDKQQIISAIEAIKPGDGKSSIAEAVLVAGAFAQSPGIEADFQSAEKSASLILFSDGRISDLDQLTINADDLTFHCIGQSGNNVAITAMQASRLYENPEQIEVFATAANYSDQAVTCDVQLSINGNVLSVKSVTIPAIQTDGVANPAPGRVSVNFVLSNVDSGLLEVRLIHMDYLASDNAAWSILSPPEKLSVLLVTGGNLALESALQACPLSKLDVRTPQQFDAMDQSALSFEQTYDIFVLDNHMPPALGKGRYLVFGWPLDGIDVSAEGVLENQTIVDWSQKHPVLKYVNLTNFFAATCFKMNLPNDADVLAEFNESPALALLRRDGSVFLLAGFDVLQTNWPFEPGFVLFCYNAVNFLGMQSGQNQQTDLLVGEPIIVDGLTSEITAQMDGPGFTEVEVQPNPTGTVRFADTFLAGPYRLKVEGQPDRIFAVNMLDVLESNIQPNQTLDLTGKSVEAQPDTLSRANLPLWPYLVCIALILACVEWLVYTYKVKI
jgi:hypothetical protein